MTLLFSSSSAEVKVQPRASPHSFCLLLPDGHQAIGSSALLPFPPTSLANDKFPYKHICLLVVFAFF